MSAQTETTDQPAGSGSGQLTLPGVDAIAGVTITSTGAVGLGSIDADGAHRLLTGVETATSATNWIIGDLTLEQMVRSQSGDTSLDTVPMPADQAHARRCLRVAIEFPHERRRPALSWSHHDTVHALDPDAQDRWLDDAEQHGWTVATLRERIREDQEQASPPLPGTRPWTEEHRSTITAVAKVLAAGRPVLVHPDGRWEEAGTTITPSNVVDIGGSDR